TPPARAEREPARSAATKSSTAEKPARAPAVAASGTRATAASNPKEARTHSGVISPPPVVGAPAPSFNTRVELAADSVEVPEGAKSATIIVHRRGSLRGEAPFTWWTETGTAKPVSDFTTVAPRTGLF